MPLWRMEQDANSTKVWDGAGSSAVPCWNGIEATSHRKSKRTCVPNYVTHAASNLTVMTAAGQDKGTRHRR